MSRNCFCFFCRTTGEKLVKFAKSSSTVKFAGSHMSLALRRKNVVINVSEQEYIEFRTVPGHQYPICKVLVPIYRFFFLPDTCMFT